MTISGSTSLIKFISKPVNEMVTETINSPFALVRYSLGPRIRSLWQREVLPSTQAAARPVYLERNALSSNEKRLLSSLHNRYDFMERALRLSYSQFVNTSKLLINNLSLIHDKLMQKERLVRREEAFAKTIEAFEEILNNFSLVENKEEYFAKTINLLLLHKQLKNIQSWLVHHQESGGKDLAIIEASIVQINQVQAAIQSFANVKQGYLEVSLPQIDAEKVEADTKYESVFANILDSDNEYELSDFCENDNHSHCETTKKIASAFAHIGHHHYTNLHLFARAAAEFEYLFENTILPNTAEDLKEKFQEELGKIRQTINEFFVCDMEDPRTEDFIEFAYLSNLIKTFMLNCLPNLNLQNCDNESLLECQILFIRRGEKLLNSIRNVCEKELGDDEFYLPIREARHVADILEQWKKQPLLKNEFASLPILSQLDEMLSACKDMGCFTKEAIFADFSKLEKLSTLSKRLNKFIPILEKIEKLGTLQIKADDEESATILYALNSLARTYNYHDLNNFIVEHSKPQPNITHFPKHLIANLHELIEAVKEYTLQFNEFCSYGFEFAEFKLEPPKMTQTVRDLEYLFNCAPEHAVEALTSLPEEIQLTIMDLWLDGGKPIPQVIPKRYHETLFAKFEAKDKHKLIKAAYEEMTPFFTSGTFASILEGISEEKRQQVEIPKSVGRLLEIKRNFTTIDKKDLSKEIIDLKQKFDIEAESITHDGLANVFIIKSKGYQFLASEIKPRCLPLLEKLEEYTELVTDTACDFLNLPDARRLICNALLAKYGNNFPYSPQVKLALKSFFDKVLARYGWGMLFYSSCLTSNETYYDGYMPITFEFVPMMEVALFNILGATSESKDSLAEARENYELKVWLEGIYKHNPDDEGLYVNIEHFYSEAQALRNELSYSYILPDIESEEGRINTSDDDFVAAVRHFMSKRFSESPEFNPAREITKQMVLGLIQANRGFFHKIIKDVVNSVHQQFLPLFPANMQLTFSLRQYQFISDLIDAQLNKNDFSLLSPTDLIAFFEAYFDFEQNEAWINEFIFQLRKEMNIAFLQNLNLFDEPTADIETSLQYHKEILPQEEYFVLAEHLLQDEEMRHYRVDPRDYPHIQNPEFKKASFYRSYLALMLNDADWLSSDFKSDADIVATLLTANTPENQENQIVFDFELKLTQALREAIREIGLTPAPFKQEQVCLVLAKKVIEEYFAKGIYDLKTILLSINSKEQQKPKQERLLASLYPDLLFIADKTQMLIEKALNVVVIPLQDLDKSALAKTQSEEYLTLDNNGVYGLVGHYDHFTNRKQRVIDFDRPSMTRRKRKILAQAIKLYLLGGGQSILRKWVGDAYNFKPRQGPNAKSFTNRVYQYFYEEEEGDDCTKLAVVHPIQFEFPEPQQPRFSSSYVEDFVEEMEKAYAESQRLKSKIKPKF